MKTAMSRISGVLALLLIAAMMLTMVGCGTDPQVEESYWSYYEEEVTKSTTSTTGDAAGNEGDGLRTTTSTTGSKDQGTTATTQQQIVEMDLSKVPDSLSGTKITMLIWWSEGGDDTQKSKVFETETGIKVTYNTQAMDKYQTNLSAMVMAQNSPSIAAIVNEWYPQPITRGLMQPVSNVKGWDYSDTSVFSTSLMDQFGYKGKHYGIAVKGGTNCTFHVMFYNKKILAKCGVKEDPYTLWKAGNWNWDMRSLPIWKAFWKN